MDDTEDIPLILRRAALGTPVIVVRQIVTFLATTLGGIVFARLFSPSDFGIFALILSVLAFVRLISEGGLGASLIQAKSQPTVLEYKQLFTGQLIATFFACSTACLVVIFSSNKVFDVANWKITVVLSLLGALFVPITSNAIVVLERGLRYSEVGLLSMIQPVSFYLLTSLIALSGLGTVSLGLGFFASQLLTAIAGLLYGASIGLTRDFSGFKSKIRFGLPFLGAQAISVVKDSVTPLFIGITLGAASAGFINWAQTLAVLPSLFVMSLSRYIFPVLSRVSDKKDLFQNLTRSILIGLNLVTFPLALSLIFFSKQISLFIYGESWRSAVDWIPFLAFANLLVPMMTVLVSALNALNKPRIPFFLSLLFAVLTWIFIPVLTSLTNLGATSYVVSVLILQIVGPIFYLFIRGSINVNLPSTVFIPLIYSSLPFLLFFGIFSLVDPKLQSDLNGLIFATVSLISSFSVLFFIYRNSFSTLREVLRGK